jgi:hypothetical protein
VDTCKKPSKLTQKRVDLLEEQVAKCLSESFILDTAKGMHFWPRDVDMIAIAKNENVVGLMRCLKVFAENNGLLYKRTYLLEFMV